MSRGIADTSVFVAAESGRSLGSLPDELAISVITLAELELGVLRASDAATRAGRLATLMRVRAQVPSVEVSDDIASAFAALAAQMREEGVRGRVHDVWIAATAVWLGVPVYTQDADFEVIPRVEVQRV